MRACVPPQSLRLACHGLPAWLIWSGRVTGLRRLLPTMSRHVSLSWISNYSPNRRRLSLPSSLACTLFSLFLF